MSENDSVNTLTIIIDRATYRTSALFGDKITLEEILANRVMKNLEREESLKSAQTACLSSDLEV